MVGNSITAAPSVQRRDASPPDCSRARVTTMRLPLKIIERAHLPALAHEKINNVRTNQARAAGD